MTTKTVSHLSDEELSAVIAVQLDPDPKWPTAQSIGRSRLGYWFLSYDGEKYIRTPRDMVNDPAMTVMLLRILLDHPDYECIITHDEIEMGAELHAIRAKGSQSFVVSLLINSLGRAVAKAFLLSRNSV